MTTWVRLVLLAAVIVSCVGCDQSTKHMASRELKGRAPMSFLAGTVQLSYAENPGAFLSLGADLPAPLRSTLFLVLTSAMVLGLVGAAVAVKSLDAMSVLLLGLIAAGGLGNLIDRWTLGLARDFLVLRLGPVHTGIFNVADIAITLGVLALLAVRILKPSRRSLDEEVGPVGSA